MHTTHDMQSEDHNKFKIISDKNRKTKVTARIGGNSGGKKWKSNKSHIYIKKIKHS